MNNIAKFFIGKPVSFNDICNIYPPTVDEVITESNFASYLNVLSTNKNEYLIEAIIANEGKLEGDFDFSSFDFLLANAYNSNEFEILLKEAIKFFTHEEVSIIYDIQAIVFGNLEEILKELQKLDLETEKVEDHIKMINNSNFEDFQKLILSSVNYQSKEDEETFEDWLNLHPKIFQMKCKARERDKVKAKKEAKDKLQLENILASICCMGIGLTPLNIGEISYASLNRIIHTNQKKEKYENDCLSLMLGADADKIGFKY